VARKRSRASQAGGCGCLILVVLLVGGAIATHFSDSGTPSTNRNSTSKPSLAMQLAVIDTKGYVAPGSPIIHQIWTAFETLRPKCREKERPLSDELVKVHQIVNQKGLPLSLLSVIEDVNSSIPKSAPRMQCAQVMSAWAVLAMHDAGVKP
jgi:hypothetical protein